jgi:heme oxygenase
MNGGPAGFLARGEPEKSFGDGLLDEYADPGGGIRLSAMDDEMRPTGPSTGDFSIRERTADAHHRLDTLISRLDFTDAADYGRFCAIMAAGFAAGEAWLAAHWQDAPPTAIRPARAGLAGADLALLGGTASRPDEPSLDLAPAAVPGERQAQLLGLLYTLEGSRLGAKVIRQRLAPGLPQSFLADEGVALPFADLRRLLRALEPRGQDLATAAALAMFACFQSIAEAEIGPAHG